MIAGVAVAASCLACAGMGFVLGYLWAFNDMFIGGSL